MGLQEDVNEIKNEVLDLQEKSLAKTLLEDVKKMNKRMFILIIIILIMWFLTIAYLIYILNDIGTIEATQEVNGIETIENSNLTNGDYYGEDKTNKKN